MSRAVFYIGPSGSGKTTALRTLDPRSTFIINALGKDLPWRGSAKQYTKLVTKGSNKEGNLQWISGNTTKSSSASQVVNLLKLIDKQMPHIKDVAIDDNTFITSLELLRRARETTWDKYTDIASNFIAIADLCKSLREDLTVHILHHTQTEGDGVLEDKTLRAMSYGKFIDEKLGSQEAQFTLVIRAAKEKTDNGIEYVFYTADPNSTAKTPMGMFESERIPNDIAMVSSAIRCYYDEENCEESAWEKKEEVLSK